MRALLILVLASSSVLAHDWYEQACCSGRDCNEVPDGYVQQLGDGVHVRGFGVLRYDDQRLRWSPDGKDHICSPRPDKLNCVYRRRQIS